MSKLWMVIKREYGSRVRKKSFILTTLLAPVGFVIFFIGLILIMSSGAESRRMAVIDEANVLELGQERSLRDGIVTFVPSQKPIDELKESFKEDNFDAILYLPADQNKSLTDVRMLNIEYYSDDQLGVNTLGFIKKTFSSYAENLKIDASGIDKQLLASFETSVNLTPKSLDETKDDISSYRVYVATFLGGAMMFLIYIVIFVYGNMVMRSVMEEKTNRIVEVIVSSVKPFQLMLGKIIGVGAVGLTQFLIWAITIPLLYLGVGFLFAGKLQEMQESAMLSQVPDGASDIDAGGIMQAINELGSFNYGWIIGIFLLFFLVGYMLYASLFAAIGAAMGDDWGEGQSLTLIIGIPVILAFYMGIATIENPNGTLAHWSSMFPLFSPVVMPARAVFDPPTWQIWLSLGILILTCWFFVWISGRIYRVGILMYGKKTTLMELVKWIFRKD